MYGKIILASLAAVATAAPSTKFVNGTSNAPFQPSMAKLQTQGAKINAIADAYTLYSGDGSTAAGWPSMDAWSTYDELWASYSSVMPQTCGWNGFSPEDSADEIAAINTAIQQIAGESGLDNRFILAVIMQESKGCVRVGNTDNGVNNPGLMQSHNGSGTCAGVSPCPADMILQMVRDGSMGTASGDGLMQTREDAVAHLGSDTGAQAYYIAARQYNSGSVNYADLNDGITSTACYATDVANRLQGWILAATGCNL